MRKILPLLVLMLFMAGCAGFQNQQPQTVAAHTGTQGIALSFVNNFPPPIMYSSSSNPLTDYSMILELRNKGAFTTSGFIHFSGYDPKIITNMQQKISFASLEGKSTSNIDGGYTQIANPPSGGMSVQLPANTDQYNSNIVSTACYDYKTQASLQTCVDPDPYGLAPKSCNPYGASVGGGQGAPLAVSSVQQESLPGKVIYRLQISNSGGGQIIRQQHTQDCIQLKYQDQNVVVSDIKLSGQQPLSCKPGPEVRLINGVATIVCTFQVTGNQAYTTTLDVNFDYGYINWIQKQIQIKKI